MLSISERFYAVQSSIKSVNAFYNRYRLGTELKRAGAYKQKGVHISDIVKYLMSLVYTGKSMFQDLRSETPFTRGFRKDTVYRFMNMASVNWQAFLLSVARKVVDEIKRLTSEQRSFAFVIDETLYKALYAKKTELVSWVYDHAEKGRNKIKCGFRMLTLSWTDGVSLVPLAFRHLASSDKEKQCCGANPLLDKRSRAYRIRREAVSKATEVLLIQLKAALKAGITAKHVLFDSWFAYPATITKIHALGLHVTARVKDTATISYLVNGERRTARQIFKENRKRCGMSRYLLSVEVMLRANEDGEMCTLPARLVYVRNRRKRNEWVAIVTTDLSLTEEGIISLYGKRWDIEVFFKVCKSYLRLTGEFRQISYDSITAHTALVMIRYMILSVDKRTHEDPRSLGDLFYSCYDEVADIRFERALMLIMGLLSEVLENDYLGLTKAQMAEILDVFITKLSAHFGLCLQPCKKT
jgi:hypothetical protein